MAKASGDIGVLSMADIGIVALALEVMEEFGQAPVRSVDEAEQCDSNADPEGMEHADAVSEDSEEEDEEESGWVTKDNLTSVLSNATSVSTIDSPAAATVKVACASTDFAVQNVCARLGVPILGCDGRLISEIRTYVLWCAGCMKRCLRQDKRFCPACGNATLQRISAQLDQATGKLKLFFKQNYQYRLKGTRHSLPKPKGGKHSLDPIVCEWQRVPQQRPTKKSLQRANPFAAGDPVGDATGALGGGGGGQLQTGLFPRHDLTSRAAVLGIKGGAPQWSRRNPNQSSGVGGRRKKKR